MFVNAWIFVGSDVFTNFSLEVKYIKLAYIEKISEQLHNELQKLCKQYCMERNVKIVFNTFEIGSFTAWKIELLNT